MVVGRGDLDGKGVYAVRDFKKGEVVIEYQLAPLTFDELKALPHADYLATHNVNGQIYLYPEPARYVNHSDDPNTYNDLAKQADIALRDITQGEMITVDGRTDDVPVLKRLAAVVVTVPSVDEGLDFYRERLGMQTVWRGTVRPPFDSVTAYWFSALPSSRRPTSWSSRWSRRST